MKSVNNKYLEINFRTPSFLNSYENEIRGMIRQAIHRGTLDVSIFIQETKLDYEIHCDLPLVNRYADAFTQIATHLNLTNHQLRLDHFLRLDKIVTIEEKRSVESIWHWVKEQIEKALTLLNESRRKEGMQIKADLLTYSDSISQTIESIQKGTTDAERIIQKRMQDKLADLLADQTVDENRLMMEVALLITKMDISEEIQRIKAHNQSMNELLETDERPGRSLEFIAQEMLREANTIGAKASMYEISQKTIQIKTAIEKIREQIRNIE